MTLVTGTVQDLGYDGMEGTLWARPARFRSDGSVVYAPERKPFKITGGVVSAELAPGPAVLELQVGSHARDTFEVVIPDTDTTLADLLDAVFPWEPEQVSRFVAEREAAEQAASDAEVAAGQAAAAAGTATAAAQQTGQDRSHVDQVAALLDETYDESQAGMALPPRLMESELNATYATANELYVNVGRFGTVGDGVADDTLAVQSAIDYALANGSGVFFPAGTYKVTAPLRTYPVEDDPMVGGVKGAQFMGAGVRQSIIQGVGTDLFHWAGDHLRIEKLRLVGNGGHVFRQVGHVKWSFFDDLYAIQQSDAYSIYSHTEDLGNYLFNEWTSTVTTYHQQTATVPTFHFRNSGPSGAANANTFALTPHRSGNYVFWFESGRDGNYIWDNVLREIRFEDTRGGCVKVLGGYRAVIQKCSVYDTLTGTRPLFYFGKGTSASNPTTTQFTVVDDLLFSGTTAGVDYLQFEQASPTSETVTGTILRGVRGTGGVPVDFGGTSASVTDSNLTARNDVRVTYPNAPTVPPVAGLGPNLVRGEKNNGLIYWTGTTSILTATADGVVVNNDTGSAQSINIHMPGTWTASDMFMLTVKLRDIVNFPSVALRVYTDSTSLADLANTATEQSLFTPLRSGSFLVLRIAAGAQFTIEYARAQRVTGGVQFEEGGALKYRSLAGTVTTLAGA